MHRTNLTRIRKTVTTYWYNTKWWGRRILRLVRSQTFVRILVTLVFIAGVGGTVRYWTWVESTWDWLAATPVERESYSTTLRNVGLLIGGVLALLIAFWRSKVADRQARISHQDVLNQRYQKGVEMLESKSLSERLGGIYELQRLVDDNPEQFHVPIMRRFCAALRNPMVTEGEKDEDDLSKEPPHVVPSTREDVQEIMKALGSRSKEQIDYEGRSWFHLNLRQSDLRKVDLNGADLASAPQSSRTRISKMDMFSLRRGGDFSGGVAMLSKVGLSRFAQREFGGCMPV